MKSRAVGLITQADRIDPLGNWLALVREADPSRWKELRGEARSALDLRVGAEVLLAYYERLIRGRLAPALKPPIGRAHDPLRNRLRSQQGIDRVLTDFGLSPHPRLVLVLEGDTELLVFPRVMAYFGIRADCDFIAIENAQEVGRDLSALIAYAVAPLTEEAGDGRYLRLVKPPTRLLAMMDAEGPYATAESREKRRQAWIKRITDTLLPRHRTQSVRESLETLVSVQTWDRKGQSFEFPHFTDRQIATAINQLDQRERRPGLEQLTELVTATRSRQGNLGSVGQFSKVQLAEGLWPVLERKMELARGRGTEARIPIVALLDRARDLAREFPRRNLVIPLRDDA